MKNKLQIKMRVWYWSPFAVIFMLSTYMCWIRVGKYPKALSKPIANEEFTNTDATKIKLEKLRRQYALPSIIDDGARNLATRFTSRRNLLRKGCVMLTMANETLGHHWSWQAVPGVNRIGEAKLPLMFIHQRVYGICVIPKVGTTTWIKYRKSLMDQEFLATGKVNMIQIRHPLDRLRSAYTDKFLGGEPISSFTGEYARDVSSREGWIDMWESYWLPALISSGQLQMTKSYQEAVENLRKDPGFYKRLRSASSQYDYNSNITAIRSKFGNVRFTFEDFLRHVLWHKQLGIGDHHWIPQTELCNVCAGDFEYIIKLENVDEEIPFILQTLNYTNIPDYEHKHPSKISFMKTTYLDFYKDISTELFDKIIELYKFDFLLFGYSV